MRSINYFLLILATSVLSGCQHGSSSGASDGAGTATYTNEKGQPMVPYKIAGDQIVYCPTTDMGVLPAEDGPYKMQVAGLLSERKGSQVHLYYTFGISVQETGKPTRIVVEDVTDATATRLLDDPSPAMKKGYWIGNSDLMIISEEATPWLYEWKKTVKVFKITISEENQPDRVLYQPAWYSITAKNTVISGGQS